MLIAFFLYIYQLSMSLNEATEIKASFKTENFFLTQFTSCLALKYHKSRPTCFFFLFCFFGISSVKAPKERVVLKWRGIILTDVELTWVITVCVIATTNILSVPDDHCRRLPFVGVPLHLRRPEDESSRSDRSYTTVKVSGRDTRVVSAGPDHSITQVNTTSPPPPRSQPPKSITHPVPYWTSSLLHTHTQKKKQAERNGRKNNH